MNVTNLLLVRASVREREMVIRSALGAQRSRLIRQMMTKSMLLAVFGGTVGVGLGIWGTRMLSRSPEHRSASTFRSWFRLAWCRFSVAIAVLAGAVVGIVPAVRLARANLNLILREAVAALPEAAAGFATRWSWCR